jgi:hypothetical protein
MKLESTYGDDPVATVILNNLLEYVSSSRFRPQKDALAPKRTAAKEVAPAPLPAPLEDEEELPAAVQSSAPGQVT